MRLTPEEMHALEDPVVKGLVKRIEGVLRDEVLGLRAERAELELKLRDAYQELANADNRDED